MDLTTDLSEKEPEVFNFKNDSPCVKCVLAITGSCNQTCQAFRTYEQKGSYNINDIAIKFKDIK